MSHKQLIRQRLRQKMDEYLARGGQVRKVEPGASGADQADPRVRRQHNFTQKLPEQRTPVNEVIAAIELRKQAKKVRARTSRRQPRKRLIYDDFGEPLRWEWVNE